MAARPRLFGTDGVRGVAGKYPLDGETVARLGRAIARVLAKTSKEKPMGVVLGEDTRESSAWLARALAAGLRAERVEVAYAGVITTPGVAFLARHHGCAAGVVISASHNPYEDNGIKVLSADGMKLAENLELEIESELASPTSRLAAADSPLTPDPSLLEDYVAFLAGSAPRAFGRPACRLIVDCAHGAAWRVVPQLAARLGVEARILSAAPDGRNINRDCGSLFPEAMARETCATRADLGVAFDGDADRAIFSTREGSIATGDHVLFAAAPFLKERGRLRGATVVGTLMTNLGLEIALARAGIALKRTPVGDKYVLEAMLRSGSNLGGEPSGHIIFSDVSLAGDGILTLLQILGIIAETGRTLGELVSGLKMFPQVIRNVRVREKPELDSLPEVARTIAGSRDELGERGRIVVRYSGTEPLARVMVEAEEPELVERHAERIAAAIESALGAPSEGAARGRAPRAAGPQGGLRR